MPIDVGPQRAEGHAAHGVDGSVRSPYSAYRQADALGREALVEKYLPLVRHIAARLSIGLPTYVDMDDLFSYGIFGLLDALERFDPERGVRFETYAFTRIKGAMLDGLRGMDWVPASVRARAREVEEAYARVEWREGRPAREDEVARELGIRPEDLVRILADMERTTVFSLDELWSDDSGEQVSLVETVEDDKALGPTESAEWRNREEALAQAIDALPERERLLISLYYYEGLVPKEIAEVMGVSVSRISQLHRQAVTRLKGRLGAVQRSLL